MLLHFILKRGEERVVKNDEKGEGMMEGDGGVGEGVGESEGGGRSGE